MNFLEKALPTVAKGVPVIRLRPNSKAAMDSGWPELATTDIEILKKWNEETPDANCGAVATSDGIWLWEVDSPDVAARVQKDTGHDITTEIQTFKVRSRKSRGHFYFKSNDASRAMGNVAQTYVLGQDWSARVNGAYCVAQNSIHPDTGQPYTALNPEAEIAEAPSWLLDWLVSQKIQKHSAPQGTTGQDPLRNESGKIPHGGIHNWMLTQAGKLRAQGLSEEPIRVALYELVEKNCQAPIDWKKVDAMAASICNFPEGQIASLALNQQPSNPLPFQPSEEISFEEMEYPVFPKWVMRDTSIYEGFVKPYCDVNSRIDYFMFLPAAVLMMNYLGTKVRVPLKGWMPSFYIVLIGEKGRAHKSNSIKDALKYLEYATVLQMYSKEIKNSDGKSVVWEAGSPEGLGTDMTRINCKNSILFYDELSGLVSKAGIEGSSLNTALLKMYESGNFANTVKRKTDAFNVAPDTYCASLIAATTDKKFLELWSKLAGEDTGLDDRFTFILQPKELPERKLPQVVPYQEAALKTRIVIDKAVAKQKYEFFDQTPFMETMNLYGTRAEIRAEKWALYFAIDMGLDEIDEECVARGIAMIKYEAEVKKYLMTYEAINEESNIQQGIIRQLKKNKGLMEQRDLERALSSNKYGTTLWNRAFFGLVSSGYIVCDGVGVKGSPKTVRMLRDMPFGERE